MKEKKLKKTNYEQREEFVAGEQAEKVLKRIEELKLRKYQEFRDQDIVTLTKDEFAMLCHLTQVYIYHYRKKQYLLDKNELGSICHALNTAAKTVTKQIELMDGMLRRQELGDGIDKS